MECRRPKYLLCCLLLSLTFAGCGGSSSTSTSTSTAQSQAPAITTQPANQTVTVGQTATFSVQATGSGTLTYQWQKATTPISGATSSSYTTAATTSSDNGSQFTVIVSNSAGSVTSNAASLTVAMAQNQDPTITTQPANQTVTVGQTATFSVQATGSGTLTYQWQKATTPISGATSSTYTTAATTASDNGSQFTVIVSNSSGNVTSNAATLTVNAVTPTTDVLTYHNDVARTGQNLTESVLISGNVTSATFGKTGFFTMDGVVDAQPLYVSNAAVPGNGTHNLLIAASEHGSVYAFDADSGTTIWQTSTLQSGETTATNGCTQIMPEIGVTSTPVIDRTRGPNGAVYVVAMSKDSSGTYHQRVHALDLALGTELFGGPVDVQATYPGTGDHSDGTNVIFDPGQYAERAGLLLMNGVIYTGWTSHCDIRPYTGWIIAYDAATLAQTAVLNVTPNGNEGSIWMAGAGLAADSSGNIYFLDANGVFDTTLNASGFPISGDYGNAFMKISTASGLAVADYFEMDNQASENTTDTDLGSGGALVLPDLTDGSGNTLHLAVGAGKDSNLYVVNRDSMGKFTANNSTIYQELPGQLPGGVFAMPAYFNNTVYYGAVGYPIQAFTITNAKLSSSSTAHTAQSFGYPGATPGISANGPSNGIVWAVQNSNPAVLHAFDATTLTELYNSNQASGGRDQFGNGNKFMTPTIVNGKVFVGTPNGVAAFSLLP
jgi:hypothetical protein